VRLVRRLQLGFLTDPEFQFEFFLAAELGMTVAEMRRRMSTSEFVQWNRYYATKSQREGLQQLVANRK
jgi:hypothetical protein